MEPEILDHLSDIKLLLIVLIVMVGLQLAGSIVKTIAKFTTKWTINRNNVFVHLASELYDQGKYQELKEYCTDKAKKHSKNPYVLYWLARAQYQLGEKTEEKTLFKI